MNKRGLMSAIRRYLLSGLLVWLPIWVTVLVLGFIVNIMDGSLRLLPHRFQPDQLLGFHLPGLGILFTLVILFFTGMFAANFLGRKFVELWNSLIGRIPVIRSIYTGVQQVISTIFSPKGKAFRKVLLVEYPRKGMWSIAFQTSDAADEVVSTVGEPMVTIFIPTTPNPTSGFLMMVPVKETQELSMSIDQALKLVISLGVVQPGASEEPALEKEKR